MPSVVTANHLHSGAVVYLARDARWVSRLEDAAAAADDEALQALQAEAMAAVARNIVTAVYALPVRLVGGRPEPVSVRERIRAELALSN